MSLVFPLLLHVHVTFVTKVAIFTGQYLGFWWDYSAITNTGIVYPEHIPVMVFFSILTPWL